MFLKIVFAWLFCCFYFIGAIKPIDMDDYYMSYLRNFNCYNKEGLRNCEKSCQNVPAICHDGECYCHQSVVETIGETNPSVAEKPDVHVKMLTIHKSPIASKKDEEGPEIMLTEEALRPALRHQIAHFCPDLEVARQCIKTCIKEGKAAFCGKDHVCYCGHKYRPNEPDNKQNTINIYKGFADMYEKYVGPHDINHKEYDENKDNDETD